MAESHLARIRRVLSASIEQAVDAMERAGGAGVMRAAVREVDQVIDDVRIEQDAANLRRLQAARQQRMFRDQLAGLAEKARFSMSVDRDDLAEAALSRQIDFEAQAERLGLVQTEAADEAGRLEEHLIALGMRRAQMQDALAAFEGAQRDVSPGGGERPQARLSTVRKVEKAEDAFDRAMSGAGAGAAISRADVKAATGVAEITALQKATLISQRMAALRSCRDDTPGC